MKRTLIIVGIALAVIYSSGTVGAGDISDAASKAADTVGESTAL